MYKFKVESYEFTLHHLLIEKDTFLYGFINWEEKLKLKKLP